MTQNANSFLVAANRVVVSRVAPTTSQNASILERPTCRNAVCRNAGRLGLVFCQPATRHATLGGMNSRIDFFPLVRPSASITLMSHLYSFLGCFLGSSTSAPTPASRGGNKHTQPTSTPRLPLTHFSFGLGLDSKPFL